MGSLIPCMPAFIADENGSVLVDGYLFFVTKQLKN